MIRIYTRLYTHLMICKNIKMKLYYIYANAYAIQLHFNLKFSDRK